MGAENMNVGDLSAVVIAVGLLIYLGFALLKPEAF
jgi:K+-transporting ATPase KdpF subunit